MATITITLSEQAQRAALLAGQPAAKVQTYDVPPKLLPRLLALRWTHVTTDGEATCVVPRTTGHLDHDSPVGTPIGPYATVGDEAPVRPVSAEDAIVWAESILPAVQAELDQDRAERIAARQEREAKDRADAERWASLPLAWRASVDGVGHCAPIGRGADPWGGPLHTSGHPVVGHESLKRYVPDAYAEAQAEVERLCAEAQAAVERHAADRAAQIARLVDRHGTGSQRERLREDKLPEREVRELLRAVVTRALGEAPAYERIRLSDLDHDDECRHDELSCKTIPDPDEIDDAGWAALKRERLAAEKALRVLRDQVDESVTVDVEPRLHRCTCVGCDATLERVGILTTAHFAGLEVSRESGV